MSLFDSFLNRAGDAAHAASDRMELAQRRRAIEAEIAIQQAVIVDAMCQIGRHVRDDGLPLPKLVEHFAAEIEDHETAVTVLEGQLADVTSQLESSQRPRD